MLYREIISACYEIRTKFLGLKLIVYKAITKVLNDSFESCTCCIILYCEIGYNYLKCEKARYPTRYFFYTGHFVLKSVEYKM
jgi:hypothetical protein